ncbi:MAG: mechanosensitive ion channel [Flavobacteriaceae bacterium]|nr:mechanosensitive ion channel [Flavobacteriaceae bacterium]
MEKINTILNYSLQFGKIHISVKIFLIVTIVFIITAYALKIFRKLFTKKFSEADKAKFSTVFSFIRYFIYVVVILFTFDNVGVNVSSIFAASAALLVGIGFALQTFFQDIISGIIILVDQSVHVGDIIELEGKVGRITEIKLRTTRAVTIENKVLIIPNHKYLTSSLYNWTENGVNTRESVMVGVAYGSDLALVKKVLLEAASSHPKVLKNTKPIVLFTSFGDSALEFQLIFSLSNSFQAVFVQSEIRFEIDRLFRVHQIKIPFPQREIYVNKDF